MLIELIAKEFGDAVMAPIKLVKIEIFKVTRSRAVSSKPVNP